jgi:CRISPR-associated protein Cmr2
VGKRGGQVIEWAMPWKRALKEEDNTLVIEQLAKDFRDPDNSTETPFSSKFFYKIRERFQFLGEGKREGEGDFTFEQKCKLLAVDYVNSGVHRPAKSIPFPEAEEKIKVLLGQCQQVKRDATTKKLIETSRVTADGALLVRFLAQWSKNL